MTGKKLFCHGLDKPLDGEEPLEFVLRRLSAQLNQELCNFSFGALGIEQLIPERSSGCDERGTSCWGIFNFQLPPNICDSFFDLADCTCIVFGAIAFHIIQEDCALLIPMS